MSRARTRKLALAQKLAAVGAMHGRMLTPSNDPGTGCATHALYVAGGTAVQPAPPAEDPPLTVVPVAPTGDGAPQPDGIQ